MRLMRKPKGSAEGANKLASTPMEQNRKDNPCTCSWPHLCRLPGIPANGVDHFRLLAYWAGFLENGGLRLGALYSSSQNDHSQLVDYIKNTGTLAIIWGTPE